MPRVSVVPSTTQQNEETWQSLLSEIQHKTLSFWNRCQIGHRSEYSVERAVALKDYLEGVSTLRAFAVCFFTPIPAVAVALAIDCLPLKPPSDGWQANYMLWIRLFVAMFVVSVGVVLQVNGVVENTISKIGAFSICLGSAVVYVMISIAVAALWRFPIPFGYVLMVGPFLTTLLTMTAFVIGLDTLKNCPVIRNQLITLTIIMFAQGIAGMAYPIFNAIFVHLSATNQTIFVFVMPMIKFSTKQIIAYAAANLHEYVGPIVAFSVNLFNVYYMTICMQMTTSTATTVIIIVSDSFLLMLALRDIFGHHSHSQEMNSSCNSPTQYLRDLQRLIELAIHKMNPSQVSGSRIRVLAPFVLHVSVESRTFVDGLSDPQALFTLVSPYLAATKLMPNSMERYASKRDKRSARSSATMTVQSKGSGPIAAAVCHTKKSKIFDLQMFRRQTDRQPSDTMNVKAVKPISHEDAVYDALQALFHAEFILMAEYIEFIVPTLYSLYLVALFHLPVAAYYPHTASMTEFKLKSTVENFLIFAGVEFVGFLGLLVLLKRKFGFSPLHQLAFVFETQFVTVQGQLIVWNLYILHLTLAHCGVDFYVHFT